jgi:glycosyltransferase involved in cell wall biosynthesis
MKPNLVILNINQLGYHTDTYNYCLYLNSDFNITYVSFHQGFKDLQINGVETISLPQPRGFWNLIKGYIKLARIVKGKNPDIVFMVYVRFISIVKFYNLKTRFVFDIRTGYLFDNNLKRKLWNLLLRFESLSFRNITIISEGLRKELCLSMNKCHWLPLGGHRKLYKKDYSTINLLYIGTLDQRNIHSTIEGLRIFTEKYPDIQVCYDIVGYGKEIAEEILKSSIIECKLEDKVNYWGYVPYDKIDEYLCKSNIGIVFIPVTPYYDYQPSTKLFEFLLSGMPVIATKTYENKLIVNTSNGVLIDDNPEGFSIGLKKMVEDIKFYNDDLIRNTVSDYDWANIITYNLKPLLFSLVNH